MVCFGVTTVSAGLLGAFYHGDKVAIFRVLKDSRQLTGKPTFIAVSVAVPHALEGVEMLFSDELAAHMLDLFGCRVFCALPVWRRINMPASVCAGDCAGDRDCITTELLYIYS